MKHPQGSLYHLPGWKNVIENTYGHRTYYLMAIKSSGSSGSDTPKRDMKEGASHIETKITGILPLVHLKNFLFGNNLISMPFFDFGGILADDKESETALLSEAVMLARELKASHIELRHLQALQCMEDVRPVDTIDLGIPWTCITKSHKVRMLLELPSTPETLMRSFKSKLRSQISKPLKEGLIAKVGGLELLEDFYTVFTVNMRDLGSPVHSKKMIKNVLKEFPEQSRIIMAYNGDQPLACGLVVGFKGTLENPWASSLRKYKRLGANMLLYWSMLEYACNNGFNHFDFGRSSQNESTYKFKEQWGAIPMSLHWHYLSFGGRESEEENSERSRFGRAIHYWQRLPVSISRLIGPMIRKNIGL